MIGPRLSGDEVARLRAVAEALIPGDGTSPAAARVAEIDRLLGEAAVALGVGLGQLQDALSRLPGEIDWASLERFSASDGEAFELVATVAAGAYFMSPAVLESLGYPTGPRSAAPFDLAAEELGSGVLDPVIAGGSRVRQA